MIRRLLDFLARWIESVAKAAATERRLKVDYPPEVML
jgi:hypothetical protein